MKSIRSNFMIIAALLLSQLIFSPILSYSQSKRPLRLVSGGEIASHVYESARVSATVSRPGQSLNYFYQFGVWQHVNNSTYTYDSKGRLTNRLTLDPSGQNVARQFYAYNSDNFNTEYTTDIWRNNSWDLGYGFRYLETYDAFGNLTESIYQERTRVSGVMSWLNKTRWTISYNSQQIQSGQESSDWNSNTNTWTPKSRAINYVYNANNDITSYIEESFSNGIWQNYIRYTNLTWQKKNDYILTSTIENWHNGSWLFSNSYSKTFTLTGGYIENSQHFMNGVWENTTKDTYDNDSFGNPLGYKRENWQNGSWVKTLHQNYIHTYNANNDITETVNQDFQPGPQTYSNSYKWVYSNFQYFNITGIKNEIPEEISTNIFPNPTENTLYIELAEKHKLISAQLSDVTGKTILTKKFQTSETKQLQLETLKPGIYFLHLQTEKGKTVRKIVKN